MDGYVSKPIRPDDLFATIATCLPDAVVAEVETMPEVAVVARDEPGHFDRAGVIERLGGDEELYRSGSHVCAGTVLVTGEAIESAVRAPMSVLARGTYRQRIAVDLSCDAWAMLARDVEMLAKEGSSTRLQRACRNFWTPSMNWRYCWPLKFS